MGRVSSNLRRIRICVMPCSQGSQLSLRDSLPRSFEHAQSIKSLSLIIGVFKAFEHRLHCFQQLEELTFPIPRCSIQHLEILCDSLVGYRSSWALDPWLRKWPPIRSLKILTNARVHFEDKQPFRDIKSIDLDTRGHYTLQDVNTLFPNLDMLALTGIPQRDSSPIVILSYLKDLCLRDIYGDTAWNTISCPNLVTFDPPMIWATSQISPSLYGFLQDHPSIQNLKVWWLNQDFFFRISGSAPQVTSLQLDGILALTCTIDWVGSNASPIFPNLEELLIYDGPDCDTIKRFNSLVVARCLPLQHSECRQIQGINKQLKILVIWILDDHPPSSWISSHLLRSVKDMAVIRIKDQGNITRYELRWNRDEGP